MTTPGIDYDIAAWWCSQQQYVNAEELTEAAKKLLMLESEFAGHEVAELQGSSRIRITCVQGKLPRDTRIASHKHPAATAIDRRCLPAPTSRIYIRFCLSLSFFFNLNAISPL
jgi:hypothetical protein